MTLQDIFSDYNPRETGTQLRMRCPFEELHEDGSGQFSMFVSPDINAYHCFSCKKKGKLTSLLTTRFDIPLSEAYSYVDIDSYISGPKTTAPRKKLLEDIFYFLRTPKMYAKRKLSEKVMRDFRVGETEEEVIIPWIEDNIVIGYARRNKKRTEKYSLDFKRGHFLYNYKKGKKSCIVVEGPADVWRLAGWGLYAVALGGTEFSSGIVDLLKTFDEIYLALDNDAPGIVAADKLYQAMYRDADVSFIEYDGDDPEKSSRESFFAGYRDPHDYFYFRMNFLELLES